MVTKVPVVDPNDLGRGITKNTTAKKYEVDLSDFVDGRTINYANGKLSANVPQGGGGLDCSAIGALKKEAMAKSTTVLGRNARGECVQVAVLDSIFQDVGVGISANKYQGFTGDSFNIKITVTNTGEGTNERTTLSIIKPALGSYTIQNQTHTSQGAGGVTKVSDTQYTITNLSRGGTVVVSFDVVGSSHGTYQFSAMVDPQSSLDTNVTNHKATISLNVDTRADPTYVATADCPAIVVTDVETGRELTLGNTHSKSTLNVFAGPHANRKLKMTGASTVVVYRHSPQHRIRRPSMYTAGDNQLPKNGVNLTGVVVYSPSSLQPFPSLDGVSKDYTFDPVSQILTIPVKQGDFISVAMRPQGANCRWQYVAFACMWPVSYTGCNIQSTPAPDVVNRSMNSHNGGTFELGGLTGAVTIDTNEPIYFTTRGWNNAETLTEHSISYNETVTYQIRKNTAKTINVTSDTCENVSTFVSNGKVKFTPAGEHSLTITVAGDAQPTDSITLGKITVQIVD